MNFFCLGILSSEFGHVFGVLTVDTTLAVGGQDNIEIKSVAESSAKRKYLLELGPVGGSAVRRHLFAKSQSSGISGS